MRTQLRLSLLVALLTLVVVGPLMHPDGDRQASRYFGTGVEPLDSRFLRWIVRRAFRRAFTDGFVRGRLSAGLLERYGVVSPVHSAVDQAASLEPADTEAGREVLRGLFDSADRPFVSISIKPAFIYRGGILPVAVDPPSPARRCRRIKRRSFEGAFAEFARFLTDEIGASVLLVPMYAGQGDLESCQRVAAAADRAEIRVLSDPLPPRELKALLALMDAHVGVRLHSCILATGAGVPSLGVQYMMKHREYFEMLGIDGYLLREERVNADALITAFSELWENRQLVREHLIRRNRELVAQLHERVDFLFDSVWSS